MIMMVLLDVLVRNVVKGLIKTVLEEMKIVTKSEPA